MRVTEKDVLYIAGLVNLELTPEEQVGLAQDLDSIVEYIGRLNELDTSGAPPMAQVPIHDGDSSSAAPLGVVPLRQDAVLPSLPREAALQNAPDATDAFFKVPKVMER